MQFMSVNQRSRFGCVRMHLTTDFTPFHNLQSIQSRAAIAFCLSRFRFHGRRRLALPSWNVSIVDKVDSRDAYHPHLVSNFLRYLHSRCCVIGILVAAQIITMCKLNVLFGISCVLGSSDRRSTGTELVLRGLHFIIDMAVLMECLAFLCSFRIHARAFGIPKVNAMGL
jgi:hypothetical protein